MSLTRLLAIARKELLQLRRDTRSLVLAFLLSGPSEAQLTVQILKGTAESVPIAIVPFAWEGGGPAPHDVAATVQADLGRSGRFRPLPREQQVEQPHASAEVDTADWRMLKVDYVLVGRLAPLSPGFHPRSG